MSLNRNEIIIPLEEWSNWENLHSFHELSFSSSLSSFEKIYRFVYLYIGIQNVISEFYDKQAWSKPCRGLVNASNNLSCSKLPSWNILSRSMSTNSSSLEVFWGVPFECLQYRLDWNGFSSKSCEYFFFSKLMFSDVVGKNRRNDTSWVSWKSRIGNQSSGFRDWLPQKRLFDFLQHEVYLEWTA